MNEVTPHLSAVLDADWRRLLEFSQEPIKPRRWSSSFSPRFACVALIRLSRYWHLKKWQRLSKFVSFVNFVVFGIEVTPRLVIGPGLVIPHSHGTVIGAGYIGANVTIFQQVTLGAKLANFQFDASARPYVCDGVIITSGAKVLGPVRLGEGAVVGANAVVISDVPPYHNAVGVPARMVPQQQPG